MRWGGKESGHTLQKSGRKRKEKLLAFSHSRSLARAQAVNSVNSALGHMVTHKVPFAKEIYHLLLLSPSRRAILKKLNTEIGFYFPPT